MEVEMTAHRLLFVIVSLVLATPLPVQADAWHYQLGEFDEAFVWLNRAIENREWELLPYLRSQRFYGDIRSDVRFGCVMHRLAEIEAMGSPTKSVAAQ
jgi:hypothetical protein